MKYIIFLIMIAFYGQAYSQDHFTLVSASGKEEHPGIPTSPVSLSFTYIFVAEKDDILVEAIINKGSLDSAVDSRTLNEGDTLVLHYITYSYRNTPMEDMKEEDPFFMESSTNNQALIFPDHDYDQVKTYIAFPVYYASGDRFTFELPVIDEEDIQRIYYPSVKLTPDR